MSSVCGKSVYFWVVPLAGAAAAAEFTEEFVPEGAEILERPTWSTADGKHALLPASSLETVESSTDFTQSMFCGLCI